MKASTTLLSFLSGIVLAATSKIYGSIPFVDEELSTPLNTEDDLLLTNASMTSTCGGTIRSFNGTLHYKPFETAEKKERCVWIIRGGPDYTSAVVSLLSGSVAPSTKTLQVTGIGTYGSTRGIILSTSIVPGTLPTTIANATVLVVSFATSENTASKGFSLSFAFKKTGGVSPSKSSADADIVASDEIGYIKYSSTRDEFALPELSVFVFLPPRNCTQPDKIRVMFSEIQLQDGLHDSLFVYDAFVDSYQNSWRNRGRISSGAGHQIIRSQDITMVVFSADGYGWFSGFELKHALC